VRRIAGGRRSTLTGKSARFQELPASASLLFRFTLTCHPFVYHPAYISCPVLRKILECCVIADGCSYLSSLLLGFKHEPIRKVGICQQLETLGPPPKLNHLVFRITISPCLSESDEHYHSSVLLYGFKAKLCENSGRESRSKLATRL